MLSRPFNSPKFGGMKWNKATHRTKVDRPVNLELTASMHLKRNFHGGYQYDLGILQLHGRYANPKASMKAADRIIEKYDSNIDILVLPELAFSSYAFPNASFMQKQGLFESASHGPTRSWASRWAKKLDAFVVVGYPEVDRKTGRKYNSAMMVTPQGRLALNVRKSSLTKSDKRWASPGRWSARHVYRSAKIGKIGLAICKDISKLNKPKPRGVHAADLLFKKEGVDLVVLVAAWDSGKKSPEVIHKKWLERLHLNVDRQVVFAAADQVGQNSVFNISAMQRHGFFSGASFVTNLKAKEDWTAAPTMGYTHEGLLVRRINTMHPPLLGPGNFKKVLV